MKNIALVSLLMACLPFLAMAQSSNDDLYFIPKKKTEKNTTVTTNTSTTVSNPGTTVVVKNVKGNIRDVDEYNRRYTSRDNTFTMDNDTLYIEEKPYNERGEWVNGFEGSQDDYEYAMRIVRFRNPRYAIPVSSPLYWDVVYSLPSWDWNVFDDGYYAYVFPTYTNRLWWDWRFDYSWGWNRPWYYGSWYSPYWFGGGYWASSFWGYHHHWHHHHMPHFAWGGYWGKPHGWNGSSARNPGIHAGRYNSNFRGGNVAANGLNRRTAVTSSRNSRDNYINSRQNNRSDRSAYRNGTNVRNSNTSGRVVTSKDASGSVRPQRTAVRTRTGESVGTRDASTARSRNTYTRPSQSRSSSYNRPSSTRSSVTSSAPSYQRKSSTSGNTNYRSSSRNSHDNSSYRSSSSRSSSRSSFSSGGGSSSRSSAGGGSSRSGGGSRGGGGRR